jgi:hypothetical protein
MEQAWQSLGKWWLVGMDGRETASWFPYLLDDYGVADVTNQFVLFGLKAGLASLALSIGVLALAYVHIGRAMESVRRAGGVRRADELLLWGLGVTLFVHAVSWLGVSYFDQSYVVWLLHVAAVSACVQATAMPVERGGAVRASTRVTGARTARARTRSRMTGTGRHDAISASWRPTRVGRPRRSGECPGRTDDVVAAEPLHMSAAVEDLQ